MAEIEPAISRLPARFLRCKYKAYAFSCKIFKLIPTCATSPAAADPEVPARAMRRQFSAAYKRHILQEAEEGGAGAIAGLLRREG